MKTSKKFKLKRLAKTLMKVAYSLLGIYVLTMIMLIVSLSMDIEFSLFAKKLFVSGSIVVLFSSVIIGIVAGVYQRELIDYRKNIRIYRSRKFASRTIEYIQAKEIRKAINEYMKCKYYESSLDDYLYGMLIVACYLSDDEDLRKPAEKVSELKWKFSPDNIDLN